jgi:GNAT superfamily N-acetyltransferase
MRKADNEQAVRDSQGQARPINRDENGNPQANRPDDEEATGAVVTPEGDVANHRDADLAKRGFISAFADETLSEEDRKSMSVSFEEDVDTLSATLYKDGKKIGTFEVSHQYGSPVATVDWSGIDADQEGRGYGSILYAEAGERVRRNGAKSLEGALANFAGVPAFVREKVFGKGSTTVSYKKDVDMSVDKFNKKYVKTDKIELFDKNDNPINPEMRTKIPDMDRRSQKLAADIKAAAQGDPATLMQRITKLLDAWELDVLGDPNKPMTKLLSISPQALSAWAYRISKLIAKTGIKFGAWAKTMAGKMTKQNMKEVWSRAVAIARSPISLVKHFLDSRADKLWEYADRYKNSATMRELANLIFTRSGPDADAVRNSIPQRIKQIRTQYANKYSNILNRFATEFAKMDEAKRKAWDKQFRRYVIGLDPLPSGDLGQAVIEFRQLMQEMLAYQKKAGIEMGDAGEGYFPRVWSSKKIQENIQKFYDAAKEMYRRRDERLLNKAIDEINQGVDAEAARKKDLDQKAGRRVKPDAEYQQDARDRANERIAELQAEHNAKDDAHYQQMAEDWAWRAQNGRLDEVSITDTNNKSANAPDHTDPRTFTAEEAAIADDFLDDDIDKTIMRYVSAAVKKSELARVFGKDGKVLAKMMIELGKDGVTEKERNHIKKLLQQSLDVSNNRLEGFDAEFFDWANFVVVSGYLGLSYINNLFLEPVSYGIRTGNPYLALKAVVLTWQNFASELVRSINDSNAFRAYYKNRKEFAKSIDMALAETLGLTHVELDRIAQDSHWDFNADAEESGSPIARWLTQRVLKANLMEQSERAKVATSMAIGRNHILNVAKTFRGNSVLQNVFSVSGMNVNAESAARSMLREMGVDDSFHDSFCTFVESLKGMNDADYMAAVTGGSQEAILYRQALQRTSTGMAISSDPSMKTEGSDSIFGKMLMQLMNYSYAYSQLVKDHMYDSALGVFKKSTPQEQIKAMDRLKYAMPLLAGGAMTTVASLATKLLVTSMFPSDSGDDWLENEDEMKVLDAASYAGMFGKKFEYLSRMVIRKQVPMGPIPEAGGKGVIALATAVQKQGDSDRANYNALKSVQRTGITPLVVGAASAANPAFGTYANYKMRDREFADAVLEALSGVEKPKK